MKRITNLLLTGMLAVLLVTACQELYDHRVEGLPDYLVVNGLLTDAAGPHGVRLSLTTPYGHPTNMERISGAQVWIADDQGNEVTLEETSGGWYHTPDGYKGQVGRSYVLHIVTPDGYVYESSPQEIKPPLDFEEVDAEFSEEIFYFQSAISNRMYQGVVEGTKVYLGTPAEDGSTPHFRFQAGLYLQHVVQIPGPDFSETYDYCWLVRNATDMLPRDIPDYSSSAGYYQHQIGFIPYSTDDLNFFSLPDHSFDHHRVLISHLYSLNTESFQFHEGKNEQLSGEGRFFDPIAAELPTNIHCVNEPGRRVFGLFEASSVRSASFRVIYNTGFGTVDLVPWEDPADIPADGCLYEEKPDFWIN